MFGADGYFGTKTGDAVIAFKRDRVIFPDDPVVGPRTMAALDAEFIGRPPAPGPVVTVAGQLASVAIELKRAELALAGFELGVPADVGVVPAPDGVGYRRSFAGATLTWHPRYGAHEVHGAIGAHYLDTLGGPTGECGSPVSDEYDDGKGVRTGDFQGGTLRWTPGGGITQFRR